MWKTTVSDVGKLSSHHSHKKISQTSIVQQLIFCYSAHNGWGWSLPPKILPFSLSVFNVEGLILKVFVQMKQFKAFNWICVYGVIVAQMQSGVTWPRTSGVFALHWGSCGSGDRIGHLLFERLVVWSLTPGCKMSLREILSHKLLPMTVPPVYQYVYEFLLRRLVLHRVQSFYHLP